MTRRVIISGVGPVSGLGIGIDEHWQRACAGETAVSPIEVFDPSEFDCQVAAEVRDFKISKFVPKHYRKATKVMARDIELAVAAADQAARDAALITPGTDPNAGKDSTTDPTYHPETIGCHIGADLIAADANELTMALVEAGTTDGDPDGPFDMHKWGSEGMQNLTPLWLLKYLPNMLACHVTITHNLQGPSNTITCNEASAGLSIGESMRVIQRGNAKACFCGGGSSKMNLAAYFRQHLLGRLNPADNADPAHAIRPFDETANGMVIGEGGAIVVLEDVETFQAREDGTAYAELIGFASAQTVNRESRNLDPDPQGAGMARAIRRAMKEAGVTADDVDAIVPFGSSSKVYDHAEAAALRELFGDKLSQTPVMGFKAMYGNAGAAAGGLDVCLAAKMLREQTLLPILNRQKPLEGFAAGVGEKEAKPTDLNIVLCYSTGLGGQNAALVLKRFES